VSLPNFEYLAPVTMEEVLALLNELSGKARLIGGGTDLLIQMKERKQTPQYLIGLKGIPNLSDIADDAGEGLKIGAMVTNQSIAESVPIRKAFGFLAEAAASIGTPQVRNLGTIGGNLCNAAPSADTAPPLLALDSKVVLVSSKREREIPLEDFFVGPGSTVADRDELLTEIRVPNPPPHSGGSYVKLFPRSSVDIAAVGVSALITLDENMNCKDARIILGAVGPKPIRAKRAEEVIRGEAPKGNVIEKTAEIASEEAQPISDRRSSADYRRQMVAVLTKRALLQALERTESR
jgi:CO/xanthine dehydrogenase FAD-binding subunit